jgi:hypothetical protein
MSSLVQGAHSVRTFRRWYWALIPLLAFTAYATVLRIGFLSDDFAILDAARLDPVNLQTFLPTRHTVLLYRPVGMLLTWILGWHVWGFNPLPYHVLGLLLHAGASLALGLWLAEAISRRWLGWLAGALFAVFPLHLEAVGWLAAQWDEWAAFFGLFAFYFFVVWWKRGPSARTFYLLSVICYGLGLFSKESLLTFLPMFPLSAWLATSRFTAKDWRRLGYAVLPFVGVLAFNLGLRLTFWGTVGGYPGARMDYAAFAWDNLIVYLRLLLAPINSVLLGKPTAQVVGLVSTLGILLGLVWYGRGLGRLLLVAGIWIVLALLPVLNLPFSADDLQNNRLLYLAAAGYCVGVAALFHTAIASARHGRPLILGSLVVLLALSVALCWVQLRPWHTATVQAGDIMQQLRRLIPPPVQPRPRGMAWYVENMPDNYYGAYVFRLGLGNARLFTDNDGVFVNSVEHVGDVDLAGSPRDNFALRFKYDEELNRFYVDYVKGITWGSGLPATSEAGSNLQSWDFRGCVPETMQSWLVQQAQPSCEPNKGLALREPGADYRIEASSFSLQATSDTSFVRLRVSVQYPASGQPESLMNQWFWKGSNGDWSEKQSRSAVIRQDGVPHVYWTFLPASDVKNGISALRFDPANGSLPSVIQWIAVDEVR